MSDTTQVGTDAGSAMKMAKEDLNFLAMLAAPETFFLLFPPFYLTLFQLLTSFKKRVERFAIGIPRGFAKTTFIKILCVWYILFSHKRFILIVGASEELAVNTVSDICSLLSSLNIIKLFGRWNAEIEVDQQGTKIIHYRGRNIILKAIGAETSVRGINRNNDRPDVIILDDVQRKEDAENAELASKLLKWILGTLSLARSNEGCTYIYVGNMYPRNCILEKLKNNTQWTSFIVGGLLADGSSLWEELKPAEDLLEEWQALKELGEEDIFISEILNSTQITPSSGLDLTRIPECPEYFMTVEPDGSFILIDPSSAKKTADDCTIEHYSVIDGTPIFDDIEFGVFTPLETIRSALRLAAKHNTRLICVEDVAYQSSLLFWFEQVCEQEGITGFEFMPTTPKGRAKNDRIKKGLLRCIKGETYLHPRVRALVIHEASEWNPMKINNTDNIIDGLGYVEEVLRDYPELIVKNTFDLESASYGDAAHTSSIALPF